MFNEAIYRNSLQNILLLTTIQKAIFIKVVPSFSKKFLRNFRQKNKKLKCLTALIFIFLARVLKIFKYTNFDNKFLKKV